jgi:hypothetical protein
VVVATLLPLEYVLEKYNASRSSYYLYITAHVASAEHTNGQLQDCSPSINIRGHDAGSMQRAVIGDIEKCNCTVKDLKS